MSTTTTTTKKSFCYFDVMFCLYLQPSPSTSKNERDRKRARDRNRATEKREHVTFPLYCFCQSLDEEDDHQTHFVINKKKKQRGKKRTRRWMMDSYEQPLPEQDFSSLVSWPHHWQPETIEINTQVVPGRNDSIRQRAHSLQNENDHSCPDSQLSTKEEKFNLTTSTSTMSIANNHLIKTTTTTTTTTTTARTSSYDQSKFLTRKHPSIKHKSTPFDEHRSAPMISKSVLEHLVFVFPENVRRILAGSKK